ncbi:hypothetical protein F2Q68_00034501 [Brassica cretica]|uniref:Uncharacterized protein n=1 Tax=Brassica cretica TaxID=69181 RepID=A0A8S9GZS3_BRACR|nr:hypothetical protein F2Q68_00034501 [Brassica cretica]
MSTLRAFTRSYIVVLPDSPLPGHPNQRSYISNQAANPFTPSAKNKGQTVGEKYSMKKLLQLPSSKSLPPGSAFLPLGPGSLPLGLGPASGHGSLPPGNQLRQEGIFLNPRERGSRRPPNLVAPVDEGDYTFHGSAENLHHRDSGPRTLRFRA